MIIFLILDGIKFIKIFLTIINLFIIFKNIFDIIIILNISDIIAIYLVKIKYKIIKHFELCIISLIFNIITVIIFIVYIVIEKNKKLFFGFFEQNQRFTIFFVKNKK